MATVLPLRGAAPLPVPHDAGFPPLPNVARLNRWLAGAWESRWLPEPEIEADRLVAAAIGRGDAALLGPTGEWLPPLQALTTALRQEARLSPLGRTMAHGQIVKALKERARLHALLDRHPDIAARRIAAPVIIAGPMRSGTTRLQRLLACDSRFSHTRMFESILPLPSTLRPLKSRMGLQFLTWLNPALKAVHPTDSRAAEEEFGLFNPGLGSAQFEAQWRIPSFARWWEEADTRPLYRLFGQLLRLIAWSRGEPEDRPWLLKAPQFTQDLPTVLEAFPGARIVLVERDPVDTVASSASLVWHNMRLHSDAVDPDWIGREWLRKTSLRQRRAAQALAARPDVPRHAIRFDAIGRDWRGEMERLYAFLGLPLTPGVLARMDAYLASEQRHLGHRYRLEDFGLDRAAVEAAFREGPVSEQQGRTGL